MKLEDIDFALEHPYGTIKLSELTIEDVEQIAKIADAIIMEGLLDHDIKAVLAAFQLYIESIIQTNEWISDGNKHH